MKKLLLLMMAIFIASTANSQKYVDAFAVGSNNGTSWTNAFNDLAYAIYNSSAGDTLWVKEGVYYPSYDTTGSVPSGTLRSFWLKNGVVVYGGFMGTETQLSQRDPINHKAILNGDFGMVGKTQHVIHVFSNIDSTAVMDGFIVKNGSANTASSIQHGGGLLLFGDAWFYNMYFVDDSAAQHGGAVYSNNSTSKFVNCRFEHNATYLYDGGAVNFNNSDIEMYNCVFQNNYGNRFGGAATSVSSDVLFQNCTFEGNVSTTNIFQHSTSGALRIYNCVLSNNSAPNPMGTSGGTIDFTESVIPLDVSWGILCPTCTNGTPTYVNAPAGNLALTSTSLGVDETLTNNYPNPYNDIVGNPRVSGASRDMGAYEYYVSTANINENHNDIVLNIYPNPTTDWITVSINETFTSGKLEILDALGQIISNQNINAQITTIQLPIENGIYLIKLTVDDRTKTTRILNQ